MLSGPFDTRSLVRPCILVQEPQLGREIVKVTRRMPGSGSGSDGRALRCDGHLGSGDCRSHHRKAPGHPCVGEALALGVPGRGIPSPAPIVVAWRGRPRRAKQLGPCASSCGASEALEGCPPRASRSARAVHRSRRMDLQTTRVEPSPCGVRALTALGASRPRCGTRCVAVDDDFEFAETRVANPPGVVDNLQPAFRRGPGILRQVDQFSRRACPIALKAIPTRRKAVLRPMRVGSLTRGIRGTSQARIASQCVPRASNNRTTRNVQPMLEQLPQK